jgi:hypothetical protein
LDFVGADETESEAAYDGHVLGSVTGSAACSRHAASAKMPDVGYKALALQERVVLFATHHVRSLMK